MRAAVGDVEFGAIAARIEAMGARARWDEADLGEYGAIDEKHTVGHHVGYVEDFPVGRNANILGHPPVRKLQLAEDCSFNNVDFDEAATELAGEDDVAPD